MRGSDAFPQRAIDEPVRGLAVRAAGAFEQAETARGGQGARPCGCASLIGDAEPPRFWWSIVRVRGRRAGRLVWRYFAPQGTNPYAPAEIFFREKGGFRTQERIPHTKNDLPAQGDPFFFCFSSLYSQKNCKIPGRFLVHFARPRSGKIFCVFWPMFFACLQFMTRTMLIFGRFAPLRFGLAPVKRDFCPKMLDIRGWHARPHGLNPLVPRWAVMK